MEIKKPIIGIGNILDRKNCFDSLVAVKQRLEVKIRTFVLLLKYIIINLLKFLKLQYDGFPYEKQSSSMEI